MPFGGFGSGGNPFGQGNDLNRQKRTNVKTGGAPTGGVGGRNAQGGMSGTGRVTPGANIQSATPAPQQNNIGDFTDDVWGDTKGMIDQQNAGMQRRAMAMQGSMGRSVAGGFAGAMGQAFATGQQNLMGAKAQHDRWAEGARQGRGDRDYSRGQDRKDEMAGAAALLAENAGLEGGWGPKQIENLKQQGFTDEEIDQIYGMYRTSGTTYGAA